MRAKDFTVEADTYQPPELSVGDRILKGKFKNSPAEITGFTRDKHNQPVLKTNRGEVQLFKPRVAKLMDKDVAEDRESIPSGKKRITWNGIDLVVSIDGATVDIRAMTGDSQMAYVVFDRDGDTLVADDLAVEEQYKGQGIAKIMYDYVKELGFRVKRSSDQLVAGKKFWDKNKGAENNIWEQGVAEGLQNIEIQDDKSIVTISVGGKERFVLQPATGHKLKSYGGRAYKYWTIYDIERKKDRFNPNIGMMSKNQAIAYVNKIIKREEDAAKVKPGVAEGTEEVNPLTNAVISFYKPVVDQIKPGAVDDYVKQAKELLNQAPDPTIRSRMLEIFRKGQKDPMIQGGVVTAIAAILTGGLLSSASRMGLSPAQTNILLQAVLNTVIPTIIARINNKSWRDTIKYTLASVGVGMTAAATLSEKRVTEVASNTIPTMGINIRSDGNIDYASLIVDGEKKYESRKTDSLRPYVGKIVGIVRTGNGPAVAIGQVTIGEPIVVDVEKFNRLRKQHLVPQGSKFDIDSDGTKYLYPMINPVRWDNEKPIKHRGIVSRKIQEQGVTEGLSIDVPNEEWLQDKIDYAERKGRDEWGVPHFGSVTAYARPNPQVSVVRLELLKGMRNEQNKVRPASLDRLKAYMEKTGKLPPDPHGNEHAPYVMVAYNGEAWVNEGNHRIMVAYGLGWEKMPVQLAYFDGGERVEDGIMYPGKIGL